MLHCLLSFVLCLTTFTCPMWCVKGPIGSYAGEKSTQSPCSKCGCPSSNSNDETPTSQNGPCESDSQCQCQGVCGGVVFSRAIDLDSIHLQLDSFAPIQDSLLVHDYTTINQATAPSDHIRTGRFLRTMHASYLC